MSSLMVACIVNLAKTTLLGRGAARKYTLEILKKITSGPIKGNFRGVPLWFNLDNTTEKKALLSDRYDKSELDFLKSELQGKESAVFVDIGANSGLYTIFLAAHMLPGSRVLAIEPNPAMFERISRNIGLLRKSGFARHVEIFIEESAVGECQGKIFLSLSK